MSTRERRVYLTLLDELADFYSCSIHAYVLMTNHVHLLMTPATPEGVSLLMRHLGQRYVQYVNRKHLRTGSLWEGRFKSCPIDSESYLLTCSRYIELNPVRAGMVDHPALYEWSSYRSNAEGRLSDLLSPHPAYTALGTTDVQRRSNYRALFHEVLPAKMVEQIRAATNGGFALGDDVFAAHVESATGMRAKPGRRGRPAKAAVT